MSTNNSVFMCNFMGHATLHLTRKDALNTMAVSIAHAVKNAGIIYEKAIRPDKKNSIYETFRFTIQYLKNCDYFNAAQCFRTELEDLTSSEFMKTCRYGRCFVEEMTPKLHNDEIDLSNF